MLLNTLTLYILMDFSIQIDTIRTGLPAVFFKGSQVELMRLFCPLIIWKKKDPSEIENLQYKKTAFWVLLSLIMRTN